MEALGFVCLPDAGYREANTVYQSSFSGKYWSSTPGADDSAFIMDFDLEGSIDSGGGVEKGRAYCINTQSRHFGLPVRLVTLVK